MIPYDKFRSGVTFESVRAELKAETAALYEQGIYRWVTRRTVLGRMREHKQAAYRYYQKTVGEQCDTL